MVIGLSGIEPPTPRLSNVYSTTELQALLPKFLNFRESSGINDLKPIIFINAGGGKMRLAISELPSWGNRIRTYDRGIKNQCLTTWLYPRCSRVGSNH